jgi:hypothetical protein
VEPAPFDRANQVQILVNPARPEEYYYPPAASSAAFEIGSILFGLVTALLVAAFGIWRQIVPK